MTIEDMIEENSTQLRQILLLIDEGIKVIKAIGGKPVISGDPAVITTNVTAEDMDSDVVTINSTPLIAGSGVGASGDTAAPTITAEDFGELDDMLCPFDPSIMGANRTKNKTGKLKGCWKKKKDAAYTEEMYMNDRRKLIAMAAAATPVDVEETTDNAAPPPSLDDNAAAPPPPQTAVTEDISELPSIPNFEIITNEAFVELCRVFILKHGDEGARCLTENMGKCGASVGTTPDLFTQQDQMSWVARKVVDHDATHA